MSSEQLFASFVLDAAQHMEIALNAEHVTEATHLLPLQKLPGSVDFLEGFMQLREEVIPVINLKKRLGLPEGNYPDTAKVAVVTLTGSRYGLLFDDIKEVFRATPDAIHPIDRALLSQDQIISALIQPEPGKGSVELLNLDYLLGSSATSQTDGGTVLPKEPAEHSAPPKTYSRYVIFSCGTQEYGVPVEIAQEITFCSEINDMYKSGIIAGTIELRGKTIPIMETGALLNHSRGTAAQLGEDSRIVILSSEVNRVGLLADRVKEICTVADDAILPFPFQENDNVQGLISRPGVKDTILLDINTLVSNHADTIKSLANIGEKSDDALTQEQEGEVRSASHHLITENCYLIFSINKHFAIELKDVKEILENGEIMNVPGSSGYATEVINLRGEVVPVVKLRNFYEFEPQPQNMDGKLIICSAHGQTVALEVDQIVTIYKQEQFYPTPSLGQQLNSKRDTLDRLIEYRSVEGRNEHVLVLNIHSLIRNHLQLETGSAKVMPPAAEATTDMQATQ